MLMRLNYPNLYYDDPNLKNYTTQNDASTLPVTQQGLPGFHSNAVRFQMLSNLANMIKTNQFKIRSKRVISELDTWVFVPGSKGMDHKDGCHDDTLTCLAMGLFVMMFSMKRTIQAKSKDAAMLSALILANTRIKSGNNTKNENKPNALQPVYFTKEPMYRGVSGKYQANMWLLK